MNGITSSTRIAPVDAIAAICARERIGLHSDAAYAGVAAIVPSATPSAWERLNSAASPA